MSLYDDLGVGASDTKTEGWSKNFKLLQSQLKVKKAALTQAKVKKKTPKLHNTHRNHSTRRSGRPTSGPIKCLWTPKDPDRCCTGDVARCEGALSVAARRPSG